MTVPTTGPTPPTGATPPAPPTVPPTPPPAPPAAPPAVPPVDADKPLGPNGEKALQAERAERVALERQLAALKPLADLLGTKASGDTKSDLDRLTEQVDQLRQQAAESELGRLRLEVATAKGLNAQQAARLMGATREELTADADALLALFPATPPVPGSPRPDPSQGGQPGGKPTGRDAGLAEAQRRFGPPPTVGTR